MKKKSYLHDSKKKTLPYKYITKRKYITEDIRYKRRYKEDPLEKQDNQGLVVGGQTFSSFFFLLLVANFDQTATGL